MVVYHLCILTTLSLTYNHVRAAIVSHIPPVAVCIYVHVHRKLVICEPYNLICMNLCATKNDA